MSVIQHLQIVYYSNLLKSNKQHLLCLLDFVGTAGFAVNVESVGFVVPNRVGFIGTVRFVVFIGTVRFVVNVGLQTYRKVYKSRPYNTNMERTASYWKYYSQKQKAERLEKELEKLQKELQDQKEQTSVYARLVFVFVRLLRGDVVDAERLSRYKKALLDLKRIAKPDDYNLIAPICEKAIAELEKRQREKNQPKPS